MWALSRKTLYYPYDLTPFFYLEERSFPKKNDRPNSIYQSSQNRAESQVGFNLSTSCNNTNR